MIRFILNISNNLRDYKDLRIEVNTPSDRSVKSDNFLRIDHSKEIGFLSFQNERYKVFILGDLIIPKTTKKQKFIENLFSSFNADKLKLLKGHFYLLIIDEANRTIECYNSMFSLLPIYYYEFENKFIISSSINLIKEYFQKNLTINRKFLIEKLVFHYAFLNDTIFNEIKLLPSNHYLKLDNNLENIRHTNIENYFTNNPKAWKRSIDSISEIFLSKLEDYFPPEHFYITLTAGFDSRTIVGSAMKKQLEFSTFSYGSLNDKDIQIPQSIADNLNRKHHAYILDEEYARHHYIRSLEEIILHTDCNATLKRNYYSYIAKELSLEVDYILSGNFGSEILRTWRMPCAMTSDLLLKIFGNDNPNMIKNYLFNSTSLQYVAKEKFKYEIDQLFSQIIDYKNKYKNNLKRNQQFYIYFFEEVFRKYFGPEIVIQNYHSLFNRTPFIDFEFITEILKTYLAGVNGQYLERNPFLRFKGQVLYSHILGKLNSPLLEYRLDRGYKPKDLLSVIGKFNIVKNYLNNNILNRRDKNFTEYNELCFQLNKEYFTSMSLPSDDFNKEILQLKNAQLKTDLSQVLSTIIYLNKFT